MKKLLLALVISAMTCGGTFAMNHEGKKIAHEPAKKSCGSYNKSTCIKRTCKAQPEKKSHKASSPAKKCYSCKK